MHGDCICRQSICQECRYNVPCACLDSPVIRVSEIALVVTERLNRIKICGSGGRITSGDEAHENGEGNGACDQPQGQNEECAGRAALAPNIDIGSKVDHLSDEPVHFNDKQTTE